MYLCVLPSVQLYFLGNQNDGLMLSFFDGKRRGVFGPLTESNCDAISKISAGEAIDPEDPVICWLIKEGCAESFDTPVRKIPPGWPEGMSRQLSAYAMHAGIRGALRVQNEIENAHVLVVGLGGIGCNIIQQLVRIGISRFTLIDPDHVEKSNLNRQILYGADDVGRPKVSVAEEFINKYVGGTALTKVICGDFLSYSPSEEEIEGFDLAVISADNAPLAIHRHAARLFFPTGTPYGFASYSGKESTLGPLVFNHSRGCGCCGLLKIQVEDVLTKISGIGLPRIPPSSLSTNAMLSAMFVDRWIMSLSGQELESNHITISMDTLDIHSGSYSRLPSCPVCGVHR